MNSQRLIVTGRGAKGGGGVGGGEAETAGGETSDLKGPTCTNNAAIITASDNNGVVAEQ